MKNIKYCILLIVLLLVGCSLNSNASEQKYVLCYTKNKSNLTNDSFVAGYNEKGKVVFEDEINGVFYYNIMKNKDKYVIDNGEVRNEYDIEGNNEETEYDINKGELVPHSYAYYKDKLVCIYNNGVNTKEKDKYLFNISVGNKNISIEGYMETFTIKNNILYVLSSNDIISDEDTDLDLISVNLDEMKITEKIKLENIKTSKESYIIGLGRFNDNNYIYYQEITEKADENKPEEINICRLSLIDNKVEKKKMNNIKFSENLSGFSTFKLEKENYLITIDSEIYEFNFEDNELFTKVEIGTPIDIEFTRNVYVENGIVYILCGDEKLMVYELDLKNKKFSKPVILESNSKYEYYALSGFLVIN